MSYQGINPAVEKLCHHQMRLSGPFQFVQSHHPNSEGKQLEREEAVAAAMNWQQAAGTNPMKALRPLNSHESLESLEGNQHLPTDRDGRRRTAAVARTQLARGGADQIERGEETAGGWVSSCRGS